LVLLFYRKEPGGLVYCLEKSGKIRNRPQGGIFCSFEELMMAGDVDYEAFGLTEAQYRELLELNTQNAKKYEFQSRASPLFPFKHNQAEVLKRVLEKLDGDKDAQAVVVAMMQTTEFYVELLYPAKTQKAA
jgi:hypothetical protein